MKLSNVLAPWYPGTLPDIDLAGLHHDSRRIKPGYLFLAYPGAATDGRMYCEQAIAAGAVAIAYDPENFSKEAMGVPMIPIEHLSKKIGEIANHFYHYPSRVLTVTGVTGTNGKTTIAYQLAQAHEALGARAAYIGTLGHGDVHQLSPINNTTPDGLQLQQLFDDYRQQGINQVCMEVSSHALTQHRVAGVEFTYAIYTNLSHEHLDYHHTMQAYAEAKATLFATPTLKWAVINQDDKYGQLMRAQLPSNCHQLTYGLHDGASVRAFNIHMSMQGTAFDVESPWGVYHVQVRTLGEFNLYNSLAVFASLLAHGYHPPEVVQVMATLHASPGRMEVVSTTPCVIVDYAHTPDALENVLRTLAQLKQGRLWVVFGCGGNRDKAKRPMMGKIASQYADCIVLTSDNPRNENPLTILDEIAAGVSSKTHSVLMSDRQEAIHHALLHAEKEDMILIAGKGHEDYQLIGQERRVFSDKDVVLKLLLSLERTP